MTQSLQRYLETGQPILVKTENNLLVPYELVEKDLTGESSIINHNTPRLFNSCLERIAGNPFSPQDFVKTTFNYINHLGVHTRFTNILSEESEEQRYLRISGRYHRELDHEEGIGPYIKKWADMTQFEREEEMKIHPLKKIDFAWRVLSDIRLAAQSDINAARQKHNLSDKTVALYEIHFTPGNNYPILDVYLKRD